MLIMGVTKEEISSIVKEDTTSKLENDGVQVALLFVVLTIAAARPQCANECQCHYNGNREESPNVYESIEEIETHRPPPGCDEILEATTSDRSELTGSSETPKGGPQTAKMPDMEPQTRKTPAITPQTTATPWGPVGPVWPVGPARPEGPVGPGGFREEAPGCDGGLEASEIKPGCNAFRFDEETISSEAPNGGPQTTKMPDIEPKTAKTLDIEPQAGKTPDFEPKTTKTPDIEPPTTKTPDIEPPTTKTPDIEPQTTKTPKEEETGNHSVVIIG